MVIVARRIVVRIWWIVRSPGVVRVLTLVISMLIHLLIFKIFCSNDWAAETIALLAEVAGL